MLNQKRRLFCQFVVAGLNNTQAAIKAGYKESSAKNIGYQLSLLPEVIECIKELQALADKRGDAIPVVEDVDTAVLCKDPIEKLIQLMNCKDELIELQAAKNLLPYFYLKKSETEAPKKIGVKELKEVNAIKQATESRFSTLGNQLSNVYDHE